MLPFSLSHAPGDSLLKTNGRTPCGALSAIWQYSKVKNDPFYVFVCVRVWVGMCACVFFFCFFDCFIISAIKI